MITTGHNRRSLCKHPQSIKVIPIEKFTHVLNICGQMHSFSLRSQSKANIPPGGIDSSLYVVVLVIIKNDPHTFAILKRFGPLVFPSLNAGHTKNSCEPKRPKFLCKSH